MYFLSPQNKVNRNPLILHLVTMTCIMKSAKKLVIVGLKTNHTIAEPRAAFSVLMFDVYHIVVFLKMVIKHANWQTHNNCVCLFLSKTFINMNFMCTSEKGNNGIRTVLTLSRGTHTKCNFLNLWCLHWWCSASLCDGQWYQLMCQLQCERVVRI